MPTVSVIIPAKNEALNLKKFLPSLIAKCSNYEIIVVNDGSNDETSSLLEDLPIMEVKHPYSKGNGAAIKSGARAASSEILVMMDGDGQHSPDDIPILLSELEKGYDMVVGARSRKGQAGMVRWGANLFYNKFSSWMTGHKIADLTSGFRAVRASKFKEFIHLLPNGFSYPTTSTMAFFRAGYSVAYKPINVNKREGKSHISLLKDGVRFLLIIFKIGTLFSPLKLFLPVSFSVFLLGVSYYAYTYISIGRFTNMSALLFTTSLIIFMVGLVSEQVTNLMYIGRQSKD
tara:strand:+ start:523 stop:1386 length:864 start_codon:yes stop_codon:yes gene_type:complete